MSPLVYVHGSGHTHESFTAQVEAFEGSDAVSLPGHPEGRPLTSIADGAAWLAKYLNWKGADKAIVAGNSQGGAIALEWSLRYPERVAGLILIGTGARLRVAPEILAMIEGDWPACIDTLVAYSSGPGTPPDLRDTMKQWHLTVGQAATLQDYTNCNGFDVMERIGSIKAPTLIIVGSEDQMTPAKYSRFLHERIVGSELAVVDGTGHLPHAEKPQPVNDLIRQKFAEAVA